MEVGFIGLGKMGRPMSERLLAAGFALHVHNRSRGAVDDLVAKGAKAANSPREIAERAEIVLSALPTPQSVDDVYGELVLSMLPFFFDRRIVDQDPGGIFSVVERLVRRAADLFGKPDAGIWEFRSEERLHVFSSLMCWAAVHHGAPRPGDALPHRNRRPVGRLGTAVRRRAGAAPGRIP